MKKIAFLFTFLLLVVTSAYAQGSQLAVYFIDVGQGDATLILSGDDIMLVDTGPDGGLSALRDQLDSCGVDQIDYLVITHPHEDHDANLAYLADNYAIAHLVMPEYADDEEDYGSLLREMVGQGTQIVYPNVGDQYAIGEATATVLSAPDPGEFPSDENLWSIVLRVDYGEVSVMMTGDAEDINEFAMIDAGLPLGADVLKVGHHGSNTSSSGTFIDAVSPDCAVVSCGAENQYGHPHEETLASLEAYGIEVYRTDLNGSICLISDGETYKIEPAKELGAQSADAEDPNEQTYILNTNTGKFHYPDCSSVDQMKEKNKREYTGTRDDLIDQGYDPCGRCKP